MSDSNDSVMDYWAQFVLCLLATLDRYFHPLDSHFSDGVTLLWLCVLCVHFCVILTPHPPSLANSISF